MTDSPSAISTSSAASGYDGARLTINLKNLQSNYQFFQAHAPSAEVAAVVKANAYGLGLEVIVPALTEIGCNTFFVAQMSEALLCRSLAPMSTIYCFNGYSVTDAQLYVAQAIRPCLISIQQVRAWQELSRAHGKALSAALHIDTGFNRLGVDEAELTDLCDTPALFRDWTMSLIMSHLACADRPDHPMNAAQCERFHSACARLPKAPTSLANSAGTLLGSAYHGDLVRCGIGLYGGAPAGPGTALEPVICVEGRILQIRSISAGETVGYGADYVAEHDQDIAIVAAGYADGYLRSAGGGAPPFTQAHILGHPVSIIGRISMDLLAVDLSHVPHDILQAIQNLDASSPMVELIGPNSRIDDIAQSAGTIAYELLTRLGNRYKRHYS